MKNLKELNSKWYWRLIKVVYIGIFIITVSASVCGVYFSLLNYNPSNLELLEDKIMSEKNFIDNLKNYEINMRNNFGDFISREEYKSSTGLFKGSGAEAGFKNLKVLLALGFSIENINERDNDEAGNLYDNWLKYDFTTLDINRNDVESWESYIRYSNSFINDAIEELNDVKKGGYAYFSDYPIRNDYEETLGGQDYLGFVGLIKLIVFSILVIFANFLVFYIIRGITLYIILGKFNPDKQ